MSCLSALFSTNLWVSLEQSISNIHARPFFSHQCVTLSLRMSLALMLMLAVIIKSGFRAGTHSLRGGYLGLGREGEGRANPRAATQGNVHWATSCCDRSLSAHYFFLPLRMHYSVCSIQPFFEIPV